MDQQPADISFIWGQGAVIVAVALVGAGCALRLGTKLLKRAPGRAERLHTPPPMLDNPWHRGSFVLVLAVACLVRAAVYGTESVTLDQASYLLHAVWHDTSETFPGLAADAPFHTFISITYSTFAVYAGHTPGFPLLVYALMRCVEWFGAPYDIVTLTHVGRGIGMVSGTVLVPLAFVFARRVVSERWALAVMAFTALHPALIAHSSHASPFILFALVLLAAVHLQLIAWQGARWDAAAGAGLALGAGLWLHQSAVVLSPLLAGVWLAVALVRRRDPGGGYRLGLGLVSLGLLLLVGSPMMPTSAWFRHVYIEHGRYAESGYVQSLCMESPHMLFLHGFRNVLGWPPELIGLVPLVVAPLVYLAVTDRLRSMEKALIWCGIFSHAVGTVAENITTYWVMQRTFLFSRYFLFTIPLWFVLPGLFHHRIVRWGTAAIICFGAVWGLTKYERDQRLPDFQGLAALIEQEGHDGDALVTMPNAMFTMPIDFERLRRQRDRGMGPAAFHEPTAEPHVQMMMDAVGPLNNVQWALAKGHQRIWAIDVHRNYFGYPGFDRAQSAEATTWLEANLSPCRSWQLRMIDVQLCDVGTELGTGPR